VPVVLALLGLAAIARAGRRPPPPVDDARERAIAAQRVAAAAAARARELTCAWRATAR